MFMTIDKKQDKKYKLLPVGDAARTHHVKQLY